MHDRDSRRPAASALLRFDTAGVRAYRQHCRPMTADRIDEEIAALAEVGGKSASRDVFRSAALERLRSLVGFDSAVFCSRTAEMPTTLNKAADGAQCFVDKYDRYVEELRPVERAAMGSGGVAVDVRVLSARQRQRMHFYSEIVQPHGVRSLLAAYLSLGGEPTAVLYMARDRSTHAPFRDDACALARRLIPVLALGDGVHLRYAAPAAPTLRDDPSADWSRLSLRERDIVEYVALGLRNSDIALACGTSANTVRNQLSSIFAKMAVANRTELARLAMTTQPARPLRSVAVPTR